MHSPAGAGPDKDTHRQVPTGRRRAGSCRRCGRTRAARALLTRRTAKPCRARPARRPRCASSCQRRRRACRPPRRCTRSRAPPREQRSACWRPTRRPLRPPQACSCAVAAGRLFCYWSESQCGKRRTHQSAHGYRLGYQLCQHREPCCCLCRRFCAGSQWEARLLTRGSPAHGLALARPLLVCRQRAAATHQARLGW